ncbi:uncharacterized protein UV8b_03958 [Ustilaginoidea virens]|uniref:Golgi apparatus membrane protein TVP38 n=1 Tax=Ustilaginoidea virens TaxID=1159556 RepID=A0A063BT08_USTVR|nr:uncharacterized protein UV8b_03958 [Ustilaginoidea virens]QUC19717.1 hypothetical protein UV8b_03958 [Ustilaginoidea virens]GAO13812.1 hypothetical protein UVI_02004660 [Ustilaginoidea virens]
MSPGAAEPGPASALGRASSPERPAARWSSRRSRLSDAAVRARSSPSSEPGPLGGAWQACREWGRCAARRYSSLSPAQRGLAVAACVLAATAAVLVLAYSHRFFAWLAPFARSWRELPGGWLAVFALVFVTAFPPVIGYSTANTIAGLVYGFPAGWPVAAAACTLGSLCAFLASRTVLSKYVDAMVGRDHRFVALGQVLRRDGVLYLTAIRFCPLPFSLSNGFLATIPSITPFAFAVSTALSTPKLLIHIFIGSRLAILAEQGDKMSARDKAINYIGIALGSAAGLAVGLVIYRRTMARAAQLAREQGADTGDAEQGLAAYDDSEAALLDPEDAAAVMMADDDVSLWEGQGGRSWEAVSNDGDSVDSDDDGDDDDVAGRTARPPALP